MTTPTWLATLPAARAVVLHAATTDEARELLDMLGLVDDTGRIVPDDTRQYDIEGAQPVKVNPKGAHLWEPHTRPETLTSPPALRVLPPLPEPEPRQATPRAPAKSRNRKRKPVPPELRKVRKQAECGTVSAIRRHTRAGEPPCEACREARREYERKRAAERRNGTPPKPRVQSVCGTYGGYTSHRRRGEEPCHECRLAMRAYFRARYAAKVNGQSATILARDENAEEVAS